MANDKAFMYAEYFKVKRAKARVAIALGFFSIAISPIVSIIIGIVALIKGDPNGLIVALLIFIVMFLGGLFFLLLGKLMEWVFAKNV